MQCSYITSIKNEKEKMWSPDRIRTYDLPHAGVIL